MTTDSEKKTKETPKISEKEVTEGLKGLLGWVQKKKEETKPNQEGAKSKSWSWVIALISAAIVFIGLAFVAWRAWAKGREIAKLKHKIDVDKEKAHAAKVKAKLHKEEEYRKKLEKEADKLENEIEGSLAEITKLETERVKAHKIIDEISTWEDVDKLLERK